MEFHVKRKIRHIIYFIFTFLIPALFIGGSHTFLYSQSISDSCQTSVICPGEELVYEVSWLNVKLGQIRLKTSPSTNLDGKITHHAAAYIDSYEGLPLVDLHAIDHTDMDTLFYSTGFHAMETKGKGWRFETARYDFPHKQVIVEKVLQKERKLSPASPVHFDTVSLSDSFLQDGLSIVYFARANVHRNTTIVVPTLVYGKLGKTRFNFSDETVYEEIDAVKDKKIRVVQFTGKAEFEGLFGFTGDFKGWFSDDSASVPIKAEMKVILGSAKIELIEWKRNGWNPHVR
jgi:hypothetical protein